MRQRATFNSVFLFSNFPIRIVRPGLRACRSGSGFGNLRYAASGFRASA